MDQKKLRAELFSFEDFERTNKARKPSYHLVERFFKDLSNGHIVLELGFPILSEIFASFKNWFAHKNRTISNLIRDLTRAWHWSKIEKNTDKIAIQSFTVPRARE